VNTGKQVRAVTGGWGFCNLEEEKGRIFLPSPIGVGVEAAGLGLSTVAAATTSPPKRGGRAKNHKGRGRNWEKRSREQTLTLPEDMVATKKWQKYAYSLRPVPAASGSMDLTGMKKGQSLQ